MFDHRSFFFRRVPGRKFMVRTLTIVLVIILITVVHLHSNSSELIDKLVSYNVGSYFRDNEDHQSVNISQNNNTTKLYDDDSGKGNDILLTLVRNSDLDNMLETIKQFEERFNSLFHYDWYFMNNEDFTEDFKKKTTELISGRTKFIKIPHEFWSYPDSIDQEKAEQTRVEAKKNNLNYGDSESYRFMCRFNSGFFYKLEELRNIDYYWRIEPSVRFKCDIPYDVFQYMRRHKKIYGFNMALQENTRTIPSLWDTTTEFFKQNPDFIAPKNNYDFTTDDNGKSYNLCHFWSNFEIAHLDFYRSAAYNSYFDYLEGKGGFFYERWGDAPIHTLAVSYMLRADQIHFVGNTGYYHEPNQDCPRDILVRNYLHCDCNVKKDFTWHKYSCVNKFFEVNKFPKPDSYDSLEKNYPDLFESIDQKQKNN
ncbi:hypothetical protein TPHA_0G03430 [Tetrapisispora phaffii CBS 4417]|uniref:Glycosyltransferase family 15 protein n=1 Tax=Tetrapisispora phaffii (strain ATCC 24235 / CBS 4417 / NBRC 1672 / NRRL Y-8282 / UCD 70-5) TaxID=1071381 RepID=G8BWA5_TETPH|nr:hypothetical protein TPHA_0G03430 [Tetrapisispora phaffii CBS 4417]CCE64183.1 hypothetical protein TPHA_0G03430 [Tetrapisispora phaffii CBS 4417]